MPFRYHSFRAAVATGLSLWMAVLACLIGCTLPTFANTNGLLKSSSSRKNSTGRSQPDLMAGMGNCPHHSTSNVPAKQGDRKPVRGGGMSCCPVEVTVASNPNVLIPHVAVARDFLVESGFGSMTPRFLHSVEFVPPLWHSGRDTLLKIQLLRI
jgi:hypothetical protein